MNKSKILDALNKQFEESSQQLKASAIDFKLKDEELLEARSKLKALQEEILLHQKKKPKGILSFLGF